ncbi:MAG TPA: TIGR02099 family protein [Cycloclasticus sp.]|nr:TIGR02099 family protein [Cycloclasticus sp.]HIL91298.1 TIGR02099 family protein [Cycloclasticus sp.]
MSKVRLFGHSVLWIFTVSMVVLALVLMAARLVAMQVPSYKHDLEVFLSEETGTDISVDGLSASMNGFQPQISLLGVTLGERSNPAQALQVGEIRLSFNPLSFIKGRINPNKITILKTDISIKRFADGHLSILGLSNNKSAENSTSDFSWLLEDGYFEVLDSQITWQDGMRDVPDVTLKDARIVFKNNDQKHVFSLRAKLPEGDGESIAFSVDIDGDPLSDNDWNAKGYLKAEKLHIDKYLSRLKVDELSINHGVGDLELWSRWDSAQLTQVKGYVVVEAASLLRNKKTLAISQFNSQFDWLKTANGWSLTAKDFSFEAAGSQQEKSQFSVKFQSINEGQLQINIELTGLNLAAISSLAQHSDLLDQKTANLLQAVNPSGRLNNVTVSLLTEGEQQAWAFCGQLKDFSSHAYEQSPGVKNVTLSACATTEKGWIEADTADAAVYFKGLFRDPIELDELTGQLTWFRDANGWAVSSNRLVANTPHFETATRFKLQLPTDGSDAVIDLQAGFGHADGRFTSLYLPVGIMGEGVVNWLDSAFTEGQVTGGGVLLKGALPDFPYRDKQGIFQVLFDTESVLLHYADDWPDVVDASAQVEFKNEGMRIVGSKGRISGNNIANVLVDVADLKNDHYLNVSGKVNDDIGGLFTFFEQSPIKQTVGALLQQSRASGEAMVDLNIAIPLRAKLKTRVKAQATLSNNTLMFPKIDVALENIQGVIKYSEQGLSGAALRGRFLGQPLTVDIYSQENRTLIKANGPLNTAVLAKKYPSKAWQYVNGDSAAELLVTLPHAGLSGGGSSSISLSSDLVGIAVDLPAPVGKVSADAKRFNVELNLGQTGLPMAASYGDKLKGYFHFIEDEGDVLSLSKGSLHFGGGETELPAEKGFKLSGFVKALDVKQWREALHIGGAKSDATLSVNQLDITLGELNWLDRTFSDVQIKGVHTVSHWAGDIVSPSVSGQYVLPDSFGNNEIIQLDLMTLKLPPLNPEGLRETKSPLNPDEIPNINLKSKALFLGDAALGAMELRLRRKHNGMIIEKLSLESKRDQLQAYGAWELEGGVSRTGLKGQLTSKSLGSLLNDTGVFDDLEGAPADVVFDVYWPGEPQEFSKNHLNGYGQIKTSKGKLLDVEPGIGRIFGLLSLYTLKRRLQLDFSDLIEKGLSFDKIKGRFTINDGDAITKRFYLESPSARIDFDGRVGLGKEDFDQLITVTPNSTESLPIAGALAGGPLVGAAVFIVQKIAGKTLNKFVGYQYRVTGPWSDPKIKQISKPGGKIFGMVDNALTPVFDASIGQLPFKKLVSTSPTVE